MREFERIRCAIIRGGTSKGVFLLENDLPRDPVIRDRVILAIFGSPDPRQINGLGGADSLTSKVAIIGRSGRPDADVDYTFGQVSITAPLVDYRGNCGNISSAVGPFAVDEGLVKAVEPVTTVRIFNTNTGKIIAAEVPVKDGRALTGGDLAIDGVPGTGARITLNFLDSGGAVTGKLLPTGNLQDEIILSDGTGLTVSLVDAANPAVFFRAADLGLTGVELPDAVNSDPQLLARIEEIRSIAAEMMGLAGRHEATAKSPAVPKIVFVSPPCDYRTSDGRVIAAGQIDLVARTMSMQKMHKAFAVTGGICTATAAKLEGTVVSRVLGHAARQGRVVRLGHPAGVLEFEIEIARDAGGGPRLEKAAVARTARRIMDGFVYVPRQIYWPEK
ncbi:3-methylitaconate isomerase [Desulfofundulus thermobenzoicus]|uniref:3-methylitaconate isomerase n=1 Tax=Desulfofundulus thermobenzoicus TaxID=29376 RepID=A0A6N7IPH4_9FIRM|nr:PrpF domain-containing protein [Desulfofundulus thermobenzoicus]MQL51936.1 3-methylitaconate isomerase [Desulfofundulus thermobenzoicus]HHW44195.1 3-methylitaconate isomerase [Desulfotomaculum sp.]